MKSSSFIVLFFCFAFLFLVGNCHKKTHHEKLKPKHNKTCTQVENIVRDITWSKIEADPTWAAKLLRLHYHDCFVRGCDASLLLDSTEGNPSEKEARPNLSLTGYEIIDEIKSKLESECPDTISCADILALVARDAVSFQFNRPLWKVALGREDGKVSIAQEAIRDLPSGGSNFTTLLQQFADNGLNLIDLVALSGAHTIGQARCAVFSRRLFNFSGKNDTDPSLDPEYAASLKLKCSTNNRGIAVDMDPGSSTSFDTSYFKALNKHKGLFASDAALLTDPEAGDFVRRFENPIVFLQHFSQSMIKMGSNKILTRGTGEIRKNCRIVNV